MYPASVPALSVDAFHDRVTELEVTELAVNPVGTVGGALVEPELGRNAATTAYQSVAFESVAVPVCAPAVLEVMSSSKAEPCDVLARSVKADPPLLPGVGTAPGETPVTSAA